MSHNLIRPVIIEEPVRPTLESMAEKLCVCPMCGAAPHDGCRTAAGNLLAHPHQGRMHAVDEAYGMGYRNGWREGRGGRR